MNARSLTDHAPLGRLPVSRLAVELRECSVGPLATCVDHQFADTNSHDDRSVRCGFMMALSIAGSFPLVLITFGEECP
jgi:hypothetical protein